MLILLGSLLGLIVSFIVIKLTGSGVLAIACFAGVVISFAKMEISYKKSRFHYTKSF